MKLPNLTLIQQINERMGQCGENEESGSLSKEQMKSIAQYAKKMMREQGIDAAEAIGMQLEDVPGIENANYEELIGQILQYV